MVDKTEQTSPDEVIPSEKVVPKVAKPVPPKDQDVFLPATTAMDIESADLFRRKQATKLIAICGAADSGKTTFMASIYSRFQKGPFCERNFSGSQTFAGFERLCHLARTVSGNPEAETERTAVSEGVKFYHLSLSLAGGLQDHFLISDMSGEYFDRIKDSTQELDMLGYLRRAGHLLILVDGAKLASLNSQNSVIHDNRAFLRRLFENDLVPTSTPISFAVTKADLLSRTNDRKLLNQGKDRLETELQGLFREERKWEGIASIASPKWNEKALEKELEKLFGRVFNVDSKRILPQAVVLRFDDRIDKFLNSEVSDLPGERL